MQEGNLFHVILHNFKTFSPMWLKQQILMGCVNNLFKTEERSERL